MLMENNGPMSIGKNTKNIKSKYLFIADNIEKRELEIQKFPTEHMWDDVLNNTKQGKAFMAFHSNFMNVNEGYDDEKEAGKTNHVLFYSDNEGDKYKTSARKISDKVMNATARKPHSPHMSVLGGLKTDKHRVGLCTYIEFFRYETLSSTNG